MHDWQSLSHVRWDCKYHVVIVPKYRKKVIYGKLKHQVGPILRQLCQQRGVELLEGHAMADHIHMCLSVPPKFSIAQMIGFLKGKSAVRIQSTFERSVMTENLSEETCSRCQSTGLTMHVSVGLSAEAGWIGLKYKDGRLFLGTAPLLADLCTHCGHVERLYVSNPSHKWMIKGKPKSP